MFDFIDANKHCIDCWEYLQYNGDMTILETILENTIGLLFDLGSWIKERYSLKPRTHKAQCLCDECRGWIYR